MLRMFEHTNRVDVGAKELRRLAPELEDGDTAGALGVREDLDEIGCQPLLVSRVGARPSGSEELSGCTHCKSAR